jgi:putative MATE family efflux protein
LLLVGLSSAVGAIAAVQVGAGRPGAVRAVGWLGGVAGVVLMLPLALFSLLGAPLLAGWMAPEADVADAAALFLRWSSLYAPLTVLTLVQAACVRAAGNTRAPLLAGGVSLAINTVLNLLFIHGAFGLPALGIVAAALATTLARVVEALLLWRALRALGEPAETASWTGPLARQLGRMSLPLMGKELAWSSGTFAAAVLIAQLGTLPLAAFNLVSPVEGILNCLVHGFAVACGILLGHALGRGQGDQAQELARKVLIRVSAWAALAGAVIALMVLIVQASGLLRPWLAGDLHDLTLTALAITCALYGARAHNTLVSVGILRAGGDVTWLMWVDLASMWLVNVPLIAVAVLVWHWPLAAVVALMLGEEVLKVLVFNARVASGRWRRLGQYSAGRENP